MHFLSVITVPSMKDKNIDLDIKKHGKTSNEPGNIEVNYSSKEQKECKDKHLQDMIVEQERLTPPEHTSSPQGINGDHVVLSLISCFIDRCLSFYPSSFGHYVVCPSIYDFWLPLLYIQTFLDPCLIFIT